MSGKMAGVSDGASSAPYVPRLVLDWDDADEGPTHRAIDGTLAFVDISGFTAMSERLAKRGKVGAEEVTDILNSTFARLLAVAYENGGSLLKFGGDALLLFFTGPSHVERACHAAAGMRRKLREIGRIESSSGLISLRMSVGVHSGVFDFFLVGDLHRELIVTGPAVSRTVAMESAAVAGEILVSEATAAMMPSKLFGREKEGGRLLTGMPKPPPFEPPASPPSRDATRFIPEALRGEVGLGSDPEHRRATVAFLRYEGVDATMERHGPVEVASRLHDLVCTAQRLAQLNRLTFLATDIDRDGGKIILVAGAPWSTERDEEQMLRAVRGILESDPPLPVRIGVNQGRVFAGDVGPAYRRTYTIMGDAVNLAARLMAKAEPGHAIATPAVLERARAVFATTELEPFTVKGKAELVRALDVGPIERSRGARPTDLPPLVGRDRELEVLLDGLRTAESGHGVLVELVAEPGMGKSRLLEELRWRAGATSFVSVGAEQYESATTYYLVRRLLRATLDVDRAATGREAGDLLRERVSSLAPELLPWLPLIAVAVDAEVDPTPESERLDEVFKPQQLQRAVVRLLAAAIPAAAIIVLEDVHWMDEASAEVVRMIAADVADRPWLVCVTRRAEGPSFAHAAEGAGRLIELEPLPADAATDLMRAVAGDVTLAPHELERLAERAGGNPLFLRELVSGMSGSGELAELPETIEAVIGSRIDRLPPRERAFLRHAAVLGQTFELGLLGDVLERPVGERTMRGSLADFVVREGPDAWGFRHALIRDVAYEGLPFRRRRELHERVGLALETRAGDDLEEVSEALSLHFQRAQDLERAWRYSVMAGDRARAKFASVQAAEFYERAVGAGRRLPDLADEELLPVSEALGDVCERAGLYERASSAYRSARRLAGVAPEAHARLCRKEGVLRLRLGKYSDALRWYTRGLRADGRQGSAGPEFVQLSVASAVVRYYQGKYPECIAWCKRMIPEALAANDQAGLAHAYLLLHLAYTHLGSPDRVAYRGLALPLFEELGDFTRQGYVLNNMGIDAYYDGDWDLARDLYERGRRALEQAGGLVDAADVMYNIAEILSDQGHLEEAERRSREILAIYRAARYPVGEALATTNLGRIATRAGRLEEGSELLEDALRRFAELGDERYAAETECRLVEAAVFGSDPELALSLLADCEPRVRRLGDVPALLALVTRLRGYALAQAGQRTESLASIDESERIAREGAVPYELGLTLEAKVRIGSASQGPGGPDVGEEARGLFDRLGVVKTPLVPLPG